MTLRKLFETYANIRPARELPGVETPYSGRGIDLVIVRENVEDLYAGIEHMQTPGVAQCLKLISRKGSEKIVRLAFEFARSEGRKSVACATKANIMKFTEGLFKTHVRGDRARVPRHRVVARDRRQLRPPAGEAARAVRRDRDDEHERRHPQRPQLGAGRRSRVRAVGQPGQRRRHLRAGARLGAQVRRQEHDQPDRRDRHRGDDASPPRPCSSRPPRSRTRCSGTLEQGTATRDIKGDDGGAASTTEFTDAIIANLGSRASSWTERAYRPSTCRR